jgi:hypothetical protein
MKKRKPNNFDEAKLTLSLLKENFIYRDRFEQAGSDLTPIKNFLKNECYIRLTWLDEDFKNTKDLIDPLQDIDDISIDIQEKILPTLFNEPAIRQVVLRKSDLKEYPARALPLNQKTYKTVKDSCHQYMFTCLSMLPDHERVIKIALRKKPKQIEREFKNFLDSIYKTAKDLKPDMSRKRKEAWTHLEVWKLRKKRMPFSQIAIKLDLTEDNARKSFYRAYELTQGKQYDPDELRREIWVVKISELRKTCAICELGAKGNCTDLCPDVLPYTDQDTLKHTKESLSTDISHLL